MVSYIIEFRIVKKKFSEKEEVGLVCTLWGKSYEGVREPLRSSLKCHTTECSTYWGERGMLVCINIMWRAREIAVNSAREWYTQRAH